VTLFCDIYESTTHVKGRCPLLKKVKNLYAMTCGYAVYGLGFYYIPHSVICVVEGEMNAMHVKAEMERLLPAKTTWVLQEIAKD
jgi:hypothetical protein